MKKVASILLAALMVMSLAACGSSAATAAPEAAAPEKSTETAGGACVGKDINAGEPAKIAFVTMSTLGITNELYDLAKVDAVQQYPNVEIVTFDSQYDVTKQNEYIEECITQGFDVIVTEALDTEALNASIMDAEEAGLAVITLNCGASATHTLHLQGTDYGMGYLGGQYLAEALGGKGKIAVLDFPTAMLASARQFEGFSDALAEYGPEIEVVDHQNLDDVTTATAMTTCQQVLTKLNNEVDAIYCVTDDIALGAVQALEAAGVPSGKVKVWGGTGYSYAFDGIRDGSWYGTSWCDTYGQVTLAIEMGLYYIASGVNSVSAGYESTPVVYQSMFPVTKDNVDVYQPLSRWDLAGSK